MDLNLKNKKALVVASSQGLGKAIAAQLAQEGANVMITSRDEAKLQAVQKEFRDQYNVDVSPYRCYQSGRYQTVSQIYS